MYDMEVIFKTIVLFGILGILLILYLNLSIRTICIFLNVPYEKDTQGLPFNHNHTIDKR